jgi:hypothetical protein
MPHKHNFTATVIKGGLQKRLVNPHRLVNLLLVNHMPACQSLLARDWPKVGKTAGESQVNRFCNPT